MNKITTLKVGFPVHWGNLIPSLQHTGYADALMANQFEALVVAGTGGVTQPLAAKSWTVSEDFKVFTFKVDTERKFSNGEQLTASDFKRSWEYGLTLDPKSSNSSLQDVMYRVLGFENFNKTGHLEGVTVIDKETLKVEFKESFRMALNHLAGSRMSAFIKKDDSYLGTGPYILTDKDKTLYLSRNEYSTADVGFDSIEIIVVPPTEASDALSTGLVDIYTFAEFANIQECFEGDELIGCYSGAEAQHRSLMLNGMSGRFFENKDYRKAIQSLVKKSLTKEVLPSFYQYNLNIDPQIYLPLQIGRLDTETANMEVAEGEKHIAAFIAATQKDPLYMITSEENNWMQDILESAGVKFTEDSGFITTQERVKMYYKTHKADVFVMAFSVASGDPDGIYHALGKNGSIGSPIQYRPSVSDLLEEGRHILDLKKADAHYKRVSEETLREVPFVHLGFTKTIVAYRKDKIKVKNKYKKRDDSKLSIYEAI
ncbi:MAG: ABC transporter substrate-binding protein [Bdellovibrionaceae bacterium]|nr:ABC transporter substrate-binding protein [Pseudobdellovibrionaceae bacterium]